MASDSSVEAFEATLQDLQDAPPNLAEFAFEYEQLLEVFKQVHGPFKQ